MQLRAIGTKLPVAMSEEACQQWVRRQWGNMTLRRLGVKATLAINPKLLLDNHS
jgi:hypothetical protein